MSSRESAVTAAVSFCGYSVASAVAAYQDAAAANEPVWTAVVSVLVSL